MCASLQVFIANNCTQLTPSETMWKAGGCKSAIFTQRFYVDMFAFETALVNAAMHVGAPLRLRRVEPVPDASTPTGWK